MSILQKIQSELKAPKNQFNSFGKYNYRSLEDIMEALKPILATHGASLIVGDDMVALNDRVYVKATATLYDSEMKVIATNTALARESETKKGMDDSQITGSTSSYARKYCLNGLFCIDDTRDADATNKHGKDDSTTPKVKPAPMPEYKEPPVEYKKIDDYMDDLDKIEFKEDAIAWKQSVFGEIQNNPNMGQGEKAKLTRQYNQVLEILPPKHYTGDDVPL